MKTVKILHNVIHQASILQKGATHQLEDAHAQTLIQGGHAEPVNAPAPKTPAPSDPAGEEEAGEKSTIDTLLAKSKEELIGIVSNWNQENPDKLITLNVASAKKAELAAAIAQAAGYAVPNKQ